MSATGKGLVVPLALLVAGAVAAAVWVIPIDFPTPGKTAAKKDSDSPRARARQQNEQRQIKDIGDLEVADWETPKPADWTIIEATLAKMRPEPPEIGKPPEPPTPSEGDEPDTGRELDWLYAGSIIHDALRVAQVRMGPEQVERFLFEGDVVPDPEDPEGRGIRIVSVDPSTLIVHWLEKDHELKLGEPGAGVIEVAAAAEEPAPQRPRSPMIYNNRSRPDPATLGGTSPPTARPTVDPRRGRPSNDERRREVERQREAEKQRDPRRDQGDRNGLEGRPTARPTRRPS